MEKKKILVIDDEQDIVETIRFRMQQEGYACICANDGVEGLNKARSESPNLILLDIMLPKMNGHKLARLLKYDEKYQHIPIIMISAKTQETDRITGIETGADVYVTKPFDMDQLLVMIKQHIL
jgi:DNA-binding response OmpR family regulator